MKIFKEILVKLSSTQLTQKLLEKNVKISQFLLGIGSGTGVFTSGEFVAFKILKQKIKPPYCIFDVGSNQGQYLSLILDNISIDDAVIHCFEPSRETFQLLKRNINNNEKIILNNLALSNVIGKASLYYDKKGSGLASLTKREVTHFGIDFKESETVNISTIDEYCLEKQIDHIDLLKIDIEGHELAALTGARELFNKNAISIVTFEFGGSNIDTRTFFQDFWYFFSEVKMDIFRITPSGYLFPIKTYNEIYEQFRTTNFIAILNKLK